MRLFVPFYRKPLPVFNAPAINNAIEAVESGPLYSAFGWGGRTVARSWQVQEGAQLAQQAAVVNGIGGVTVMASFGSQGLIDPTNSNNTAPARGQA